MVNVTRPVLLTEPDTVPFNSIESNVPAKVDPVSVNVTIESVPTVPRHLPVRFLEYPVDTLAITTIVLVPAV